MKKKSIFKSITAIMLLVMALSLTLLNGCQKNVGDVYDYKPVVLAPDFEITEVVHAFDNDVLNSASVLTFKVVYKNNEVTETTYPSVLNFYVDNAIQESIPLEAIAAGINYETSFEYKAKAGEHNFTFQINLSSDGTTMVDEGNTANNSETTSLTIATKKLVVVKEIEVETTVVVEAIAADSISDVASVLADEGVTVSTTVEAIETTFDDNTTAVVAAIEKADGSIDSTKVVLSATFNVGVAEGQEQEAISTMIVETLVEKKEVSFYNAKEKLTYTDGVVTFVGLKSAQADCSEPSNFEAFSQDPIAVATYVAAIAGVIDSEGVEAALASASTFLLSTMQAFGYTQGEVDNAPTYSVEILNSNTVCSSDECVNDFKVKKLAHPGFRLTFTDDRGDMPDFTEAPDCATSNNGTYPFVDCGGNAVSYTFSMSQAIIETQNPCVENIHN